MTHLFDPRRAISAPLLRALALLLVVQLAGCATLQRGRAALDSARTVPSLASCDCKVVSLAVGRLGVDETPRIWVAEEKRILELAPDGTLTEVWEVPRFARLLRLEAADLDGDGIVEWVVLYDTGRFRSHVLRWTGDSWESSKPWAGFLRPDAQAGEKTRLLGQSAGSGRFHGERIVEITEAEGKLVAGEQVVVAPGVFLYDFFWVPGERPRLFVLEEGGSISERDPRSPRAVLWRSEERIVARPLELRRSSRDMLGESTEDTIRFAPPVVLAQWDDDPTPEVFLVTGPAVPMFAFENLRISGGGDVRVFDVGERGLQELVRTPLLGLDLSATWAGQFQGELLWIASVWMKDLGGFAKPESRLFRFNPSSGDPRAWAAGTVEEPSELAAPPAPAVQEDDGDQGQN